LDLADGDDILRRFTDGVERFYKLDLGAVDLS